MRISDWSSDVCSSDLIDTEVERLQWAAVVGGISLVLSLLIAWRLGYLIRRPLLDISAAANRLRNLDFDTPPLGRTRLRELDDASQAINSANAALRWFGRSEEHTSELQSLMRTSYAVFCLKKKNKQ